MHATISNCLTTKFTLHARRVKINPLGCVDPARSKTRRSRRCRDLIDRTVQLLWVPRRPNVIFRQSGVSGCPKRTLGENESGRVPNDRVKTA